MEPMPDTVAYLLQGLGATFLLAGGYIFSLFWRFRSAEKDVNTIEKLKN
jgi:hypothetical protein